MNALLKPWHPRPAEDYEIYGFLTTYLRLLEAAWRAKDRNLRAIEGAVRLHGSRRLAIPDQIIHWMLYQGHLHHVDYGVPPDGKKKAIHICSLIPGKDSRFALTLDGEQFAEHFLDRVFTGIPGRMRKNATRLLRMGMFAPHYDQKTRQFRWGRHIIKHFRQPSPNQELILCAAEELNWPAWFDDPLPVQRSINPKLRLHNAVNDLNRRQLNPLVHFKSEDGTRIGWEYR